MFKYVHHVHYVVQDRQIMVDYLDKTFGMKPSHLVDDEDNGVKDALYDIGPTQIQISEPVNAASSIARHLATSGPGVYHVAWAVDDIATAAHDLAARGSKLRGKNPITQSPRGYQAVNIDPASSHGLWFQLIEDNKVKPGAKQ